MGNAHANIVPYQVFDASDGQFVVAVGNDGQFAKFCEAAGQMYHQDPRFLRNDDRVRNRDVLIPLLAAVLKQRTVAEWISLFEPLGIPVGGINNLAQVFDHAQVRSREMRIDLPHPQAGTVPMVANPIKMSGTPLRYQSAPPLLGQHTREVLADAGLTTAEIEQLQAEGIV
jgi:crotonobetainyl-CoA:carnitine CoA-transferase CaiB-like acyl-CoA transferase